MKQTRNVFVALLAVFLAWGTALAVPAAAQDTAALQSELDRLRRDLTDLQRAFYRGEPPPAGVTAPAGGDPELAARLEVRLSELEDEMRSLTGRVEEVAHGISQVSDRLDKLVADVDFRLTAIEQAQKEAPPGAVAPAAPVGAGIPAPPTEPGTLGTIPASALPAEQKPAETATTLAPALPPGTPKEQYKYAYDLLRQMDYAEAERALKAFIEAHPDDALTGNAFYWLAETFYVRGDYEQAVAYFARGYQDYGESPKAPDNLLKLAMSLARLGRKDDACVSFDELDSRFPNASPAIKRRVASERQRLGCN
ncbi:MAG: tol-pal system protein YbgF [Alphaproteobacteria bacterium]